MNIKPMLVRFQNAMGRNDLIEQMVLMPEPAKRPARSAKSPKSINLVIGYNRTPSSQTALDVTLWIAHQTRLATQKHVTVHIVHVVDDSQCSNYPEVFSIEPNANSSSHAWRQRQSPATRSLQCDIPVLTQPRREASSKNPRIIPMIEPSYLRAIFYQNERFEQADHVLWQARCLADEWGGSFTAHLRFGDIATELRQVVESEAADVLFLGCDSVNHSIVQKLGSDFPCSVLGIPKLLNIQEKGNTFSQKI